MYDNQQQRTDGRINGIMTHLYYLLHLCFARLFTSAFYYFLSVLVRFGGRSFLIFMSICLCLSFSIYRERDSIFFISVFTFLLILFSLLLLIQFPIHFHPCVPRSACRRHLGSIKCRLCIVCSACICKPAIC